MAASNPDPEWPEPDPEEDPEEEEEQERAGSVERSSSSSGRPRRFSLHIMGKTLATLANNVGESLARTAAAAGELLTDAELRSRSVELLSDSAKKAGAGVAKGLQQGAGRIAAGPRTVQSILQKLQQRIEEQRLQALLREQQDAPVDVQVAFQLYEDSPQELRSRLWMALLEHPEIVHEYQRLAAELQQQRQQAAAAPSTAAAGDGSGGDGGDAQPKQEQQAELDAQPPAEGDEAREGGALGAGPCTAGTAGSEAPEFEQSTPGLEAGTSGTEEGSEPHSPSDPAHLSSSHCAPWAAHRHTHPSGSGSGGAGAGAPPGHVPAQPLSPRHVEEADGWQLVSDQAAAAKLQGGALLVGAARHPAYSRDREGFRNVLMTAMMSIPWPLPNDYPPDCRYATLLQISLGQEDIDEVISRDLHRTFPEHPLFAFEQGQQALFNVLKAYALHDMEASYCQGMAFVAGLLLFYVPEEPAFQLFCRLLSTSGPNLRRLYLPGLEGLKCELRKLDFLLERFLPNLTAHLNAAGVVPVLYASQWLLTCYSCPFPVSFACRIVDAMLQENRDRILLQVAVAILAECEGDLMMQEGFEALLTHLKADVVTWSHARLRRVLSAALASPISDQDFADAEAALELGFTGSLSRAPTYSADAEAPDAAAAAVAVAPGQGGAEDARDGVGVEGGVGSSSGDAQPGTHPGAAQMAAGGAPTEDTVAADLAAQQQQIDDDLMQMVMDLNFAWGGEDDAEESYSNTLHSAVQGGAPPG